ncbi:hypothetical protein Ndes2526B_g02487 [Nannochloris sp. 'desiccata']
MLTIRSGPELPGEFKVFKPLKTSMACFAMKSFFLGLAISPTTSSSSSEIEPPNVQKLAQLAQVGVSEQEAAEWAPKIAGIVEWFGQLQQVDLEGVPPAVRADIGDANLLRPDQPRTFENRQVMLEQIPEREGPFTKVPKMVQGEAE